MDYDEALSLTSRAITDLQSSYARDPLMRSERAQGSLFMAGQCGRLARDWKVLLTDALPEQVSSEQVVQTLRDFAEGIEQNIMPDITALWVDEARPMGGRQRAFGEWTLMRALVHHVRNNPPPLIDTFQRDDVLDMWDLIADAWPRLAGIALADDIIMEVPDVIPD